MASSELITGNAVSWYQDLSLVSSVTWSYLTWSDLSDHVVSSYGDQMLSCLDKRIRWNTFECGKWGNTLLYTHFVYSPCEYHLGVTGPHRGYTHSLGLNIILFYPILPSRSTTLEVCSSCKHMYVVKSEGKGLEFLTAQSYFKTCFISSKWVQHSQWILHVKYIVWY